MPFQRDSHDREARSRPVPSQCRLNVLVVEDEALVAIDVVSMLFDLGHTAVEANSAEHALALLQACGYDLVLTDYRLPAMSGGGLVAAIRADWPRTKVAIISGYMERPKDVPGDVPWLTKPLVSSRIAQLIEVLGPWDTATVAKASSGD